MTDRKDRVIAETMYALKLLRCTPTALVGFDHTSNHELNQLVLLDSSSPSTTWRHLDSLVESLPIRQHGLRVTGRVY